MKAVLTDAALKDLMEIARHIGKDNIPAARRVTAALRSRAQGVGRNPRLYPFAEGFEAAQLRHSRRSDDIILTPPASRNASNGAGPKPRPKQGRKSRWLGLPLL